VFKDLTWPSCGGAHRQKKKQPLVICIASSSGMMSFTLMVGLLALTPKARYCVGAGTASSAVDGRLAADCRCMPDDSVWHA
jgi:hypothetical protein